MTKAIQIREKRDLPEVMEELKNEIASCESIPQLKELKNRAKAWEAYYKASGLGLEAQNLGAELKIRAERRMGELLKKMEKQAGARTPTELRNETPLLEDLGITKTQSHRYQQLTKIKDEDLEKFFIDLRAKFKEITTSALLNLVDEIEREAKKEEIKEKADNYQETDIKVIQGDFRKQKIEENSIDLILTDPIYGKEYLPLWQDLFVMAEKVLKPSKFLVAYSGQMYLDKIFQMKNDLIYYWTFSILFSKKPFIGGRNINNCWKPILVFQKPPFKKINKALPDLIKVEYNEEREMHEENWGQTIEPFEILLDNFSEVGDIVLDPFAGTGTTLLACKNKKRKGIGIEIKENLVKLIKGRLSI